MPEIVEIKGVGPVLAKACAGKGYSSVEKIAAAIVADLAAVPGVSEIRAEQLIGAAKSLLNGASQKNAVSTADINPKVEEISAKKEDSTKKKNNKNKKNNKKKDNSSKSKLKKKKKEKKQSENKKKKKSKKGK